MSAQWHLYDALFWPSVVLISCWQLSYRVVTWPLSIFAKPESYVQPGRVAMVAVDAGSSEAIRWLIDRWWKGNPRDRVVLVHVPEGDLVPLYPRTIRLELNADDYRKGTANINEPIGVYCQQLIAAKIPWTLYIAPTGLVASGSTADVLLQQIDLLKPTEVIMAASKRLGKEDVGRVASEVCVKSRTSCVVVK